MVKVVIHASVLGNGFLKTPYLYPTERLTANHTLPLLPPPPDLPTLLERLGLEHYLDHFKQEEVDFETFLTMTEADLQDIKISKLGARRKLQIAISGLQKRDALQN